MRAETWINRYARHMAKLIGTWEGCYDAADVAWHDGGEAHEPEASAEREVAEWRRLMDEEAA